MPTVQFSNGHTVQFSAMPTQDQINNFAQQQGWIGNTPQTPTSPFNPHYQNNQFVDPNAAQAGPQDTLGKVATGIGQGFSQAGQAALGVGKGLASTANSLSGLGQKALGGLTGIKSPTASLPQNVTTPTSEQQPGFVGEKLGEFMIPGGAEAQAGKAAELATGGSKLASLGAKAATSAGTMAGITAAQGGSGQDIKNAALVGGIASPLSAGLSKLASKLPENAWSKLLSRTPTQVSKNPDLASQAAKTGMTGLSREALSAQAGQAIQKAEVGLDEVLKGSKEKIATLKIAPYLDQLREAYSKIPGEQDSLKAIDNVARDFLSKKTLTPEEANIMKRGIYQNISNSYGKGLLDVPAKADAQKAIARGLKTEIEKVVPESIPLNKKQAVYIQMQKALDKAAIKNAGKAVIGFKDLGLEGIGLALGHPVAGLGAVVAKKAAESPTVLSNVSKLANYFNDLSPTKKILFYNAIKGLTVQGIKSPKTENK